MKSIQRHKLKENEFAHTVARGREVLTSHGSTIRNVIIGLLVIAVLVGGYGWWRRSNEARGNEQLAAALAIYEMPVVPPAAPAPGSPAPLPQPGTFESDEERLSTALPKFIDAANTSPNSRAGITARFHAASILAAQGKSGEAEQQYRQVVARAGNTIYSRTARLGLAESLVAQAKYDEAITVYTELSRDTNSTLPLDGVLLQLGRAYARAGKKEEAVRSFTRVVDEFPQSAYAADARRELEEAKKPS